MQEQRRVFQVDGLAEQVALRGAARLAIGVQPDELRQIAAGLGHFFGEGGADGARVERSAILQRAVNLHLALAVVGDGERRQAVERQVFLPASTRSK